jgi:hypothetical protein
MTAFRSTARAASRILTYAVVLAAMTTGAAAQDASNSNPLEDAPDVQFLRGIMSGLGLKSGNEPGID